MNSKSSLGGGLVLSSCLKEYHLMCEPPEFIVIVDPLGLQKSVRSLIRQGANLETISTSTVCDLFGCVCSLSGKNVMNVEITMSSDQSETTETSNSSENKPDITYALDVTWLLPPQIMDLVDGEPTKVKCGKENAITQQFQVGIFPMPVDGSISATKQLQLGKRLILCTSCGDMRLTN